MPADILRRLDEDPYGAGVLLVAASVQEFLPQDRRAEAGVRMYGEVLWRAAQRTLIWWTPERVESEALRRAADNPRPSVIAQEVAAFTVLYEDYATAAVELGRLQSHARDAILALLSALRTTLDGLERRAQATEARASDYRLRYEFERLREVVLGSQLSGPIANLIARAAEGEDAAREYLDQELRPLLARIQADFATTRLDVAYVADCVTRAEALRMLPSSRLRELASVVSDWVGLATPFLGSVLGLLKSR